MQEVRGSNLCRRIFFPFFLSFFNFFFYLQTGFNLFIVMLLGDKAY